ncbi:MAG TPA: 50S ribosomal protein L18e [Candidatus Acidoferrales bacterium]|nr:50S ribosomal protein L18e [Candidatus Acidoferrales bacterium]
MRRKITNPELLETIRFLKVKARENEAKIWTVAAEQLSKPRSRRAELDLNHISRASKPDSLLFVPGKVLASGHIKHPVTVGAFQFSHDAKLKIEQAGGKCIGIRDFVENHPKGSNVQILR